MTSVPHDRAAGGRSPGGGVPEGTPGSEPGEEPIKAPWHFKFLVAGTLGYLVYRLIWLIFWLTGHAWHG